MEEQSKDPRQHLGYKRTKPIEVPKCYKDNPEALKRRAKYEDKKKLDADREFIKWYENELMRYGQHGCSNKQKDLLNKEKKRLGIIKKDKNK